MPTTFRLAACACCFALLAAIAGCGSDTPTNGGGGAAPLPGGLPGGVSSGNTLFDQKCMNCHAMGTPAGGPKGPGKGPDLSKVGAAPDHTADWIAEHIKKPTTHKPGSKMPAFEGQLTAEQIKELADFLAAKK